MPLLQAISQTHSFPANSFTIVFQILTSPSLFLTPFSLKSLTPMSFLGISSSVHTPIVHSPKKPLVFTIK
uniref:Putative ovule protein n=1 Tax=Solanum chacoense TaxID=4108 RepID=A0A0V0GSX1_SOLCH